MLLPRAPFEPKVVTHNFFPKALQANIANVAQTLVEDADQGPVVRHHPERLEAQKEEVALVHGVGDGEQLELNGGVSPLGGVQAARATCDEAMGSVGVLLQQQET
jgi:hypothetical protein